MAEVSAEFTNAVQASKELSEAPSNDVMLQLYGLYKQSTSGDVSTKRPGFTDPVGKAKWDAWDAVKGTSEGDAQAQYVALVESLK